MNSTQVTNDGLGIELRVDGAHDTRHTSVFNRKSSGKTAASKLLQFADPDIAVADGITVILRSQLAAFLVRRRSVSLASAAFALTGSPRGFFQANTLVAVIGHAQVGASVI